MHHIELLPNTQPIRAAPYRLHPEKREFLRKELDDLLQQGIIEESEGPWVSPIVWFRSRTVPYGSALTSARSTLSHYPIRFRCRECKIYSIVSDKPDTSRSST